MGGARTAILVGPTAIGKTAVALELARSWPIEVISADSRQLYRGLDIGTAKPTAKERARVPHHLLDILRPGERYSAGRFALDAAQAATEIRARARQPIVVGGTGLYIKALAQGLFAEPPLDRPRRDALVAATDEMDHASLVRWAHRLDRGFAGAGGRHRAQRSVEVALLTGQPLSWWQQAATVQGAVDPWFIRLTVPRAVLHQRINARVDEMLRRGLLEEVAAVLADGAAPDAPGMDGVGIREAVSVLQGRLPQVELAGAIATSTRQYAKRQETWFRHQLNGPVLTLDASQPADQTAAAIVAAWEHEAA